MVASAVLFAAVLAAFSTSETLSHDSPLPHDCVPGSPCLFNIGRISGSACMSVGAFQCFLLGADEIRARSSERVSGGEHMKCNACFTSHSCILGKTMLTHDRSKPNHPNVKGRRRQFSREAVPKHAVDGEGESLPPRLGSRRLPGASKPLHTPRTPTITGTRAFNVFKGSDTAMQVAQKLFSLLATALTLLFGLLQGTLIFMWNVLGYYFRRKRRPVASYIASWIVHKVLMSVCEDVQGLQVRVDATSSMALLRGEVTGITIMASRVRLLDVSVGNVGIYTDDVHFVQGSQNESLASRLLAAIGAISSSHAGSELAAPPLAPSATNSSTAAASTSASWYNVEGLLEREASEREASQQITQESANVTAKEEGVSAAGGGGKGGSKGKKESYVVAGEKSGGLTVAQPFAASLAAMLTEQDVNTSPPIMYILQQLLTFLVRFGLSIGARKALGLKVEEEDFKSTSVELFYVKLCRDGTLRVNAAIALGRTISGVAAPSSPATTRLPLVIRLGLDIEESGRCLIVRRPELVTTGLFNREVYVPFMPLAKSGADLGPDLHLTKLLIKEGVIEAEGIVVVRPPRTLTAEQEIAQLEGGGGALDEEIDELRRFEQQQREKDSKEKGSLAARQRMQVEGELRMSRFRAAERRRLRNQRLVAVTQATKKALSPLDALLSPVANAASATASATAKFRLNLPAINASYYASYLAATSYLTNTSYPQIERFRTLSLANTSLSANAAAYLSSFNINVSNYANLYKNVGAGAQPPASAEPLQNLQNLQPLRPTTYSTASTGATSESEYYSADLDSDFSDLDWTRQSSATQDSRQESAASLGGNRSTRERGRDNIVSSRGSSSVTRPVLRMSSPSRTRTSLSRTTSLARTWTLLANSTRERERTSERERAGSRRSMSGSEDEKKGGEGTSVRIGADAASRSRSRGGGGGMRRLERQGRGGR